MHAYQLQQEVGGLGIVSVRRNGVGFRERRFTSTPARIVSSTPTRIVSSRLPPRPPPPPPTTPFKWIDVRHTPPRPGGMVIRPGVPVSPTVPFFDPGRAFTYTREQLREMKDRARSAQIERERRQAADAGVTPSVDPNAPQKPTSDSAAGAPGAAPTVSPIVAKTKTNAGPLAIAALLAYFLMT